MNDWPADPRLDASLRRLVDAELEQARAEGVRPSASRKAPRAGNAVVTDVRFQLACLAVAATVVIVAALALRGTIRTADGGADASGQPSPSASPTLTPTTTPAPSSTSAPSGAGRWVPTGSPSAGSFSASVRLADGRVLLIENPGAEIYDPVTGKFTATGGASADHSAGTATLLGDGRVLLAGGLDATLGGNLSTAEIYDPATGEFSPTGSMTTARSGHTATLLADGRVLVAGGSIEHVSGRGGRGSGVLADVRAPTPGGGVEGATGEGDRRGGPTLPTPPVAATLEMISSAELYDPQTGRFQATGSMTAGRDYAAAVRLSDGRVLIFGGGDEGNQGATSADLYDPETGLFSPTGSMNAPRHTPNATLLNDGRVLITSGSNGTGYDTSIEIYDPVTGRFVDAGSSGTRGGYSVAPLADGRVLFMGGYDANLTKPVGQLTTCDLYDPATHAVSPAASISRSDFTVTIALLDGGVLVVGQGWAESYVP